MTKISATIICRDEEAKIGLALESLKGVADEVVVVDSGSTDGTESICRRYTDRFLHREWEGYRSQKQFACDAAAHDWVLSVDADEVVSDRLRLELLSWKRKGDSRFDGYWIPRKTFFMGRWIEHTTWYPDWQLRLFRRDKGRWRGRRVHESFQTEGRVSRFREHLEHYTYSSVSEYLQQLERFSTLAAADYHDAGRRAGWKELALLPPLTFFNNYLMRRGFLDGLPGLSASALSAVSVLFKFLKLREIQDRAETVAKED